MSIKFLDGFDHYPADPHAASVGVYSTWFLNGDGDNGQLVDGRFLPGKSFYMVAGGISTGNHITITKPVDPTQTYSCGFAIKWDAVNGNNQDRNTGCWAALRSQTNSYDHARIAHNDLGQVTLWIGNSLKVTSTTSFVPGAWHFVEMVGKVDTQANGGFIKVYMDGALIIDYEGDAFENNGELNVGRIIFQNWYPEQHFCIDDVRFADAALSLGEARIQLLEAVSDHAVTWDRLSGPSNFLMINDPSGTDLDTTYNSTNTVGNADMFDMQDLTTVPTAILAVGAILCARKEDAGTRSVRSEISTPGGQMHGNVHTLTPTYQFFHDVFENDSGAAWTKDRINSMLAGYSLTE